MRVQLIADPVDAVRWFPQRPDWQRHAACRGMGDAVFFPETPRGRFLHAEAWAICERCPVDRQCLAQVLEDEGHGARELRSGLWAFSTPSERYRMHVGSLPPYDGRNCPSVRGWQRHRMWGQEPCDGCQRRWDAFKVERSLITPVEIRRAS